MSTTTGRDHIVVDAGAAARADESTGIRSTANADEVSEAVGAEVRTGHGLAVARDLHSGFPDSLRRTARIICAARTAAAIQEPRFNALVH